MSNFYTSEILLLGQEELSNFSNDPEQQSAWIQQASKDYLENFYKQKKLTQNPELHFYNQEFARFKIEDSRRLLAETAYQSSFTGETLRVFVLFHLDSASSEAQNALLKVLEEPPQNTFILLPLLSLQNILPTIQSRCRIQQRTFDFSPPEPDEEKITSHFPETRAEALRMSQNLKDKEQIRQYCHACLEKLPATEIQKRAALAGCLEDLENNFQAQLALEHCFFACLRQWAAKFTVSMMIFLRWLSNKLTSAWKSAFFSSKPWK